MYTTVVTVKMVLFPKYSEIYIQKLSTIKSHSKKFLIGPSLEFKNLLKSKI